MDTAELFGHKPVDDLLVLTIGHKDVYDDDILRRGPDRSKRAFYIEERMLGTSLLGRCGVPHRPRRGARPQETAFPLRIRRGLICVGSKTALRELCAEYLVHHFALGELIDHFV